jgi:16S rRNA (guanine1207-N2)-methyltransferase
VAPFFSAVTEDGEVLVARGSAAPGDLPPWPVYDVAFGGKVYQIQSAPGVFSPRGLDEGTRLMLGQIQPQAGARFLDLGCGTGVVSRIASDAWGCEVTAVDVSARALRLAAGNAPAARVVASDGLAALSGGRFDIIASNPPYHTDFGVARTFIEGAHRLLVSGGTLYLVVKRADWYVRKVRDLFGGCRLTEEQGYTVIAAEKREHRPGAATPAHAPTTRKHAKRQAAARPKRPR